jgi:hypothetical protein
MLVQFFFSLLGLTISSTKSEVILFSRRQLAVTGLDPGWWQIVATSGEFQVFGGIF